jgi:hypothetical protein
MILDLHSESKQVEAKEEKESERVNTDLRDDHDV